MSDLSFTMVTGESGVSAFEAVRVPAPFDDATQRRAFAREGVEAAVLSGQIAVYCFDPTLLFETQRRPLRIVDLASPQGVDPNLVVEEVQIGGSPNLLRNRESVRIGDLRPPREFASQYEMYGNLERFPILLWPNTAHIILRRPLPARGRRPIPYPAKVTLWFDDLLATPTLPLPPKRKARGST